jgi:hypothetical protein
LDFPHLNDLVYVHYNLQLWVRQLEKIPDVDAISLDNINILSEWRVEYEAPIMEEAPEWLEEEEQQQASTRAGEEQQEWGAEEHFDIMEGDVAASTPPSTQD